MDGSAYFIDRGVPLPLPRGGGGPGSGSRPTKLTLTYIAMAVGDSFWVKTPPTTTPSKHMCSLYNGAEIWGLRQTPRRSFAARREGDGVRVWRTA